MSRLCKESCRMLDQSPSTVVDMEQHKPRLREEVTMSKITERPVWVHLAEQKRQAIRASVARQPQAWVGRVEAAQRKAV